MLTAIAGVDSNGEATGSRWSGRRLENMHRGERSGQGSDSG
jgi:hypothetical protein